MEKFRVENRKISGGVTFLGVTVLKKVIGNLAYRELLFYKKSPESASHGKWNTVTV